MASFSFANMDESYVVPTGSQAGVLLCDSGYRSFTAAEQAAIADDDIVKFTKLPAGHVIEDFVIDLEDMDQGAELAFSVGFLDTAGTGITSGTEIISASTTGQGGGTVRASLAAKETLINARYTTDKTVAMIITTNPATAQVAAKIMRFSMTYRPAKYGE